MPLDENYSRNPVRSDALTVAFVGGFAPAAPDGATGGILYACRTLIESQLRHYANWILIDTTQTSAPPPVIVKRIWFAVTRMASLTRALGAGADAVLVFSSFTALSLAEKGIMCWLARISGKHAVLSLRSEVGVPANPLMRSLMRFLVCGADVIVCQAPPAAKAAKALLANYAREIVVVPNWIDTDAYPLRTETTGAVTFLFLGRCDWSKGVRELLLAADLLKQRRTPFRLVVAGGGLALPWLRDQVAARGLHEEIELPGWVAGAAKADLFRRASVLVLPSYTEGMPNAVLEGMASGLAVIATPVGGIPAVVIPDENGLMVTPRDSDSLARAMQQLAEDPASAREMGIRNAAKIRIGYSLVPAVKQWAEILRINRPD